MITQASMPGALAEGVILSVFESDERFRSVLSRTIKDELGMTVLEFSECASIPHSTMYKILGGRREPNVKTLRQIVQTIRKLEGTEKNFIAVIAARPVLDRITERQILIEGESVVVREYAASTMEDAIIAAVRAERDGAYQSDEQHCAGDRTCRTQAKQLIWMWGENPACTDSPGCCPNSAVSPADWGDIMRCLT